MSYYVKRVFQCPGCQEKFEAITWKDHDDHVCPRVAIIEAPMAVVAAPAAVVAALVAVERFKK